MRGFLSDEILSLFISRAVFLLVPVLRFLLFAVKIVVYLVAKIRKVSNHISRNDYPFELKCEEVAVKLFGEVNRELVAE